MTDLAVLSMFSGGGGLDLGLEAAGFNTISAVDLDPNAVDTMRKNRPEWNPIEADVREWRPDDLADTPDVLVAGPPCQGYSLGGNRHAAEDRNGLFHEVCRVAQQVRPRVVIVENVVNLRTMRHPETGRPFVEEIAASLTASGYGHVSWDVFKMDGHGVPQTRRRFVFVAFRDQAPDGWCLPTPSGHEPIRPWLWDLATDDTVSLPNHDPSWGFRSQVHVDRGVDPDAAAPIKVVRFSRTASDGCFVGFVGAGERDNVTVGRSPRGACATRGHSDTPRPKRGRIRGEIHHGLIERDHNLEPVGGVGLQTAAPVRRILRRRTRVGIGRIRLRSHQVGLGQRRPRRNRVGIVQHGGERCRPPPRTLPARVRRGLPVPIRLQWGVGPPPRTRDKTPQGRGEAVGDH